MLFKLALSICCLIPLVACLNNGLARTPPMGWLSWQRFRCNLDCKTDPDDCISEDLYIAMADRLVKDGYRDLGYVYVNIDDCWASKERDNVTKKLVSDPVRFPHGIKWLADYMHQKGLKLGIYNDYGTLTCGGYPGSINYLQLDAETFAEWGIDSVKMDGCYSDPKTMDKGYPLFGKYLNETGRPMLFSCSWPAYQTGTNMTVDYKAIAKSCNIWRNWGDIDDSFESVKNILDFYGNNKDNFLNVAGPGNFNDPDMIIVGDFGLSYEQQKVQMGMWAMLSAPLLMSNDLRNIRPESKALLQNKHVLAINQDPLGQSAKRIYRANFNNLNVWTKKMHGGAYAVAAVYYGTSGTPYYFNDTMFHMGVGGGRNPLYIVTDAFTGANLGTVGWKDPIKFAVNPSGINLFVLTPKSYKF